MSAVNTSGAPVDRPMSFKLKPRARGRDPEADKRRSISRGLWASRLKLEGYTPVQIRDIMGISKSHYYRLLELAEQSIGDFRQTLELSSA